VFCKPDGSPMRPDYLSGLWFYTCRSLNLPRVSLHALRHTHASALIAGRIDVVQVSRRLGHANPTVTLNTDAHLFRQDERAAVAAIGKVLG
jgi:integrase